MAGPSNTPKLDALVQDIGKAAMKHGVPGLVIVGVDPSTNIAKVYGAPQAITALRKIVAEKFGLVEHGAEDVDDGSVTEWPA